MTGSFAARPGGPAAVDAAAGGRWLRCFHPGDSDGTVLVALPHAGGSASSCHPLSRALARDAETLAVQYPGRQDRLREPAVEDIGVIADHVVHALASTRRPIALFGHSMGATVAFEVARRLEAGHRPPTALIVSARAAPSDATHKYRQDLHDDALVEEMRMLGGSEAALTDPDLLSITLPVLRSDFTAVARYRYTPGPPLSCPITALVGDQDPRVGADDMRRWARHSTAGFALHVLPGGHFYLADQVDAVARLVRGSLAPHPA